MSIFATERTGRVAFEGKLYGVRGLTSFEADSIFVTAAAISEDDPQTYADHNSNRRRIVALCLTDPEIVARVAAEGSQEVGDAMVSPFVSLVFEKASELSGIAGILEGDDEGEGSESDIEGN